MVQIAVILLKLPDGRFVFQRRSKGIVVSPGMLSLFGGHIEKGETPEQAVVRELAEETSLIPESLDIKKVGESTIHYDSGPDKVKKFFYFQCSITRDEFEVYEGDGAETYSIDDALNRSDITQSTRHILGEL